MLNSTIAVVLDRNYGDQLLELAKNTPVWIVTSDKNRIAVEAIWALNKATSPEYDVTIFIGYDDFGAEELLLSELYMIDLHYPYWSVMTIYGAALSPLIVEEFNEFEVSSFEDIAGGFVVVRPDRT